MAFRKDTPAPHVQRIPAPPSVDIASSKIAASRGETPPLTPPFRIRTKGRRTAKVPKYQEQTPRETYLEDAGSEADARDAAIDDPHAKQRISHDLSLTDNNRHSVMDNMLLSLNPDQPAFFSSPVSQSRYRTGSGLSSPPKTARSRGHKQSASLNSDYTYPSNPSDLSSQRGLPRSRRSQSSSNFPTSAGIDSITEHGQSPGKHTISVPPITSASVPTSRSGARRTSKGSGSSSVDFGHAMVSTRWPPFSGRRSSSFDHGHVRAADYIPTAMPALPRANTQQYADLDAAPTPTVPGGPGSRERSPSRLAAPTRPTYTEAPSLGSPRRFMPREGVRSSGADGKDGSRGSVRGGNGVGSKRGSQHVSSLRGYINSRAGSPVRTADRAPTPQPSSSNREKPGFFRRMFGSKEKGIPSHETRPEAPLTRDGSRMGSRSGRSSNGKAQKSTLGEEISTQAAEAPPPVLTKKPSSFFRRRKKSISTTTVTPAIPPHLQTPVRLKTMTAMADGTSQNSPVSSLHEAMDSFLSIPDQRKPAEASGNRKKGADEHNPVPTDTAIYRSYMNTTPSTKNSFTHDQDKRPEDNSLSDAAPSRSDTLQPPDRSFLHDNSSNEDKANDTDSHIYDSNAAAYDTNKSVAQEMENRPPPGFQLKPVRSSHLRNAQKKPLEERDINLHEGLQPSNSGNDGTARKLGEGSATSANEEITSKAPFHHQRRRSTKDSSVPTELEDPPISPISDYQSATSIVVDTTTEGQEGLIVESEPTAEVSKTSDEDSDNATIEEKELAKSIYDGDEAAIEKSRVAAWLGENAPERIRIRKAYMECFDFQDRNILVAFRELCARMVLKGETQQVDRILDSFSCRWCQCNPEHGFQATDVVHTICYSILLLNTDLYLAEIEAKMTRAQFIRNTMPTVRRVAMDAAPDGFENKRASTLPMSPPASEPATTPMKSPTFPREVVDTKRSFEAQRPTYRLSQRPSDQSSQAYLTNLFSPGADGDSTEDTCGPLVKAPFTGKLTTWENQVEIVLKDFYSSIRQERLPLHGNKPDRPPPQQMPSSANSLSTFTGNMLRRTPSVLSKAGSENLVYRGRGSEQRLGTGRWTSKGRSRPRLYPASTVGSSRTSFEEQSSSIWSPAVSSTWSKHSFNKTQTSMSTESFASGFPDAEYQQSIGFANALSQAIIREEAAGGDTGDDTLRAVPLLEDESLELAGAPWAKEGILKHKHHLEGVGKKSKDRNWIESFAVIEKGAIRLFSFNMNAKSMRQKAKWQKTVPSGAVVGGGNWMDNAEALGNFSLRQTIASALPPPGYSRTRPHVWALSLPTGAVHLFQVGTPEIVKEFVTTANYWSARLSKEPLVGGVSNIEYGWSDAVINTALTGPPPPPSSSGEPTSLAAPQPIIPSGHHHRPSIQSSIRSFSLDQGPSSSSTNSNKPKFLLPGDKITIHDWSPPPQSLMASALLEVDQHRALTIYVENVERELQRHNELRGPMNLAFSHGPTRYGGNGGGIVGGGGGGGGGGGNWSKAMGNWERKSGFLLGEIVKYRTYVEGLEGARRRKEEIYGEKGERQEREREKENGRKGLEVEGKEETREIEQRKERGLMPA